MEKIVQAQAKYIRIAPRKTRLLADTIRNMTVNEAEAVLFSSSQRSRNVILKLLRSAIANAKSVLKVESGNLFIKEIRVDGGPRLKRWMPRARGGMGKIEKKTSHITIMLGVSEKQIPEKFLIQKKKKKEKSEKKEKQKKTEETRKEPEIKKASGEKPTSKKGIIPKIFSRKVI